MKVLIAATACSPFIGSEAYVGWEAVSSLRHDNDLWVMTSLWCREAIDKVVENEDGWDRVHFVYVDEDQDNKPCPENRMLARLQSWLSYRHWCRKAVSVARELHREIDFDLAHHITYATWRMGSPLAGVGIPWIWGPIGGGERFPFELIQILSPTAIVFEIFRTFSTCFYRITKKVKCSLRDASVIIASNEETACFLSSISPLREKPVILSQAFLTPSRIDSLRRTSRDAPLEHGLIEIVSGGNLEGRKGVAISVKALQLVRLAGIPFRYRHFGDGPESKHLLQLVSKMCLSEHVEFLPPLHGMNYVQMLKSAHFYLLPSLRESAGLSLMEAMAAGCVPIVADGGGPASIVANAGIKPIPIRCVTDMAEEIAARLTTYWSDSAAWNDSSKKSSNAISSEHSSARYAHRIYAIYENCLGGGEG